MSVPEGQATDMRRRDKMQLWSGLCLLLCACQETPLPENDRRKESSFEGC